MVWNVKENFKIFYVYNNSCKLKYICDDFLYRYFFFFN